MLELDELDVLDDELVEEVALDEPDDDCVSVGALTLGLSSLLHPLTATTPTAMAAAARPWYRSLMALPCDRRSFGIATRDADTL